MRGKGDKVFAALSIFRFLLVLTLQGSVYAADSDKSADEVCEQIVVFVTSTCPHCIAARDYSRTLVMTHPHLDFVFLEIDKDERARDKFVSFNQKQGISQPGVPTFSVCGETIIGLDKPRLEDAILRGVVPAESNQVEIPIIGVVTLEDLGLPLFTIVLGLLDGFNPCAMWVLLFLLSILIHVKKRSRILLIASTFVIISGLVYFAFMTAWLNAFFLIGYSRVLQVLIGSIAIGIGLIHLKDFFAYGRGISLSIPDSAKPGIYQRTRTIVNADNTIVAIVGVSVLAVLVNFLELLCTAGLPALYTQVLSQHELPKPSYYGYLALYNLAYIVDDGIMVAIAVVTLGQRKMQQSQGRWLKLLSGTLVGTLGILLVVAPHWLVF
ncbi:MAG: NrdH-redoxin [Gammaproteobacteria bacterium]